jgi:predicted transcriptional regulator
MSKETKKRGRPGEPGKIAIWCRVDEAAVGALDEIAADMRPKPSRSQLIDLAVQEFVERRKKQLK